MNQLRLLLDPKRLIPIILGSVAGILVLASQLFPGYEALVTGSQEIIHWAAVVATFAILAGITNVIIQHIARIRSGDKRTPYSLALLIGVLIPPGVTLYDYLTVPAGQTIKSPAFQSVVSWVYTPLSVSLLALLTFFAVTASIRALGSGNREAIVVVIVGATLLVVQLPFMADVPLVGDIVAWTQRYVALAGLRGLAFGAAIGAVVASVRVLLGLDRPYLDR